MRSFSSRGLVGLLSALLLAGFSWQRCRAIGCRSLPLENIVDGVYTFQLASTDCYLSYQNRTCAKNEPVVRGETALWNKWAVTVLDKNEAVVSLQATVVDGRCPNGILSRSAEESCQDAPTATSVGLVDPANQGAAAVPEYEQFQLVAVDGTVGGDLYHIVAVGKPSTCARYLGATGCGSGSVRTKLAVKDEAGVIITWKLSLLSESGPSPSPLPPPQSPSLAPEPAPTPVPTPAPSPPSSPAPGPVIEPFVYGQSVVSSGFVEVSVTAFGGDNSCSVTSITFTSVNKSTGVTSTTLAYSVSNLQSQPASVPLPYQFMYDVYATGSCSDGRTTENSNVLTVTSVGEDCIYDR